MEKFKSFITEAKEEKYRILIVSAEPVKNELFHTAQRITDEVKKTGNPVYVVKVQGAYITYEDDGVYKIYNVDDEEGFEINSTNTIAIVRGTVRLKKSWLDLLSRLEKIGVCITKNLRKRWNLILGDSRKELPKLLEDLSTIDIFLHDSKHTQDHMKWEYETAWPHLKNCGLLISDDTNWSKGAFEEFAKNNNSQNIQLRRDGRSKELFGIILKNTSKDHRTD